MTLVNPQPTPSSDAVPAGAFHRLPPPGGDRSAIALYVLRLAHESALDQRRTQFERSSENGLNYYVGNQWGPDALPNGFVKITINRLQNCVISLQAIQAGDPPKITFTARESGEPALVYLNTQTPAGQAIAAAEQAAGVVGEDGQPFDPVKPLPQDVADNIREHIAMGEVLAAQAAAMRQPPPAGIVPKDTLIEVNERTAAEALQTVFDGMWDDCNAHFTYAENVLNKNVLGSQPTLYEFDDNEKRHVLKNVHPKHWFVDPANSSYDHCQHEIYLEPIGEAEAVARYPAFARQIQEMARSGNIKFPTISGFTPGYPFNINFQRGMVAIYHCWIRNQPYPMTEDEAVAAGHVARGEVPHGDPVSLVHGDGFCPGCGLPGMGELVASGFTACPSCGEDLVHQPTRPALLHPETGAEVMPPSTDAPNAEWPVKYRIRQIRTINNILVDDRQSEFANLPLPWNNNILIPFCPYGQGEPERLIGMQEALNRAVSSAVTHLQFNSCPPEMTRKDWMEKMPAAARHMRSQPGKRTLIPPEVAAEVGNDFKKLFQYAETADMPADVWKMLEFLVRMIDQEGNLADVTQGNAAAGWSGDAIAALQNAATQVIRGKSMWTEFWLKQIARLMVHSILTRMAPQDWAKHCRKYPIQALEALHAKALALDINISVEIKSGSGASKQQQSQNVTAAAQMGAPVSPQTLLENVGLDPEVEQQQSEEWQRKLAATAAIAGVGVQAPEQQPQQPATNNEQST